MKIVILQSISERQYAKWRLSNFSWVSAQFSFSTPLTQKLLNRFSSSF